MMNHMSALRPASAVVSLVYLSLMSSCISVKALSHSTEAWCPRNRADRRSALLQISSLVCLPLVSSPLEASASEDGPKPFETYGIIPDAGPKLNPQLLKINVCTHLFSETTNFFNDSNNSNMLTLTSSARQE